MMVPGAPTGQAKCRPIEIDLEIVALHLTASEKAELKRAADRATMGVSVFVRAIALAAARRGEFVVTDAPRAA